MVTQHRMVMQDGNAGWKLQPHNDNGGITTMTPPQQQQCLMMT